MTLPINAAQINWTESKINGFLFHQLIEDKNGTLKFTKIEPNSMYPEHIHPDKTEYVVVMEGNPEITVAQEKHKPNPGDVIVLPRNIHHSIGNYSEKSATVLIGAVHHKEE